MKKKQKGMEGQEHSKISKVVKIRSRESWEYYITHATNHGYPIMVHFSACWCMPSIAISPFFEELASTYQHILFLMVDVDEIKEVASKLGIKAMPTLVLISGGAPMDKIVGANPKEIRKMMDAFLHSPHNKSSSP
ncbi:thioredoxin-like protein CXXS1 [Senna tora]|uniref:Thioredoxin-like protein CXXS1 n=1 Tax=Senna tora TaxID=362788 RepID=A0A834TKB0_9FABA|nr:thioredoxin-like protein CXXS1 [Senna tora]